MRTTKKQLGYQNKIFFYEEEAIIATVNKALQSSSNAQVIGRNGELPLLNFLNKYLPNCFRALSGHFITPWGKRSPQIDIMIVDSRFPFISQNEDGSALVMLHSLVATIEVKTTLTKKTIKDIFDSSGNIASLMSDKSLSKARWHGVMQYAIAYQTTTRLETIAKNYFSYGDTSFNSFLRILRLCKRDQILEEPIGALMFFEGTERFPALLTTLSPLSDFYYMLVQDGYYTLGERNYDFDDLGKFMMEYLKWGTSKLHHK